MFRFMAFVWDADDCSHTEAANLLCRQLESASSDWHEVVHRNGLVVYCAGIGPGTSRAYALHEQAGVVVGALFERRACAEAINGALTESATQRIIATRGRALIEDYWGRYVAFLADPNSNTRWVIKDPTGRLPCFKTQYRGVSLFCSYFGDAMRLEPLKLSIDWDFITYRAAVGINRADRTALHEVTELHGGECLEFRGAKASRHLYWDPGLAAESNLVEDHASAARQLRETVRGCTQAWARFYGSILHRLSGGLDSSAVLGCFKNKSASHALTCVTYYVRGGLSDERPWARLAAEAAGCEHIECAREGRVNFEDMLRIGPLPAPASGFSYLEIGPLEKQIARERKAAAVSNGDGGDSLFGRYGTRFAIADYIRHHGLRWHLFTVAADVSMIRRNSVWKVFGDAARNPFVRPIAHGVGKERLREGRKLVRSEAFEAAVSQSREARHPFFQHSHVADSTAQRLTLAIQPELFYNPLSRPEDPDPEPLSPLLSQPVVELCLRIPIYVHIAGGRDRGVARRAFAPDVPRQILTRQWKDGVQGFAEDILKSNERFIRELLLDGILVRERVLDRGALEKTLSSVPTANSASPGELVDHIATEVWLRSWDGLTLANS